MLPLQTVPRLYSYIHNYASLPRDGAELLIVVITAEPLVELDHGGPAGEGHHGDGELATHGGGVDCGAVAQHMELCEPRPGGGASRGQDCAVSVRKKCTQCGGNIKRGHSLLLWMPSAMWSLRHSRGPLPWTAAWEQKPRKASMATRPFFTSFSFISSVAMPMGSKG